MFVVNEHLYQIYPQMPKYAAQVSESQFIQTYQNILQRYQILYGSPPKFFIKSPAIIELLGDSKSYTGYSSVNLCSTQGIIVAIGSGSNKIKVNGYQSTLHGVKELDCDPVQWKTPVTDDQYTNIIMVVLRAVLTQKKHNSLLPMNILIYSDYIHQKSLYYQQSLTYALYLAVNMISNHQISFQQFQAATQKVISTLGLINFSKPFLHGKFNNLLNSRSKQIKENIIPLNSYVEFDSQLSLVIAHSMTPEPKIMIQGKRLNLRHCQILIGIEIIKCQLGFIKLIDYKAQLQSSLSCTIDELIETVMNIIPSGKLNAEEIEEITAKSLIDILKPIAFANEVIDQNINFNPQDKIIFFLREQKLCQQLTTENLKQIFKKSQSNANFLLDIGSEQINELIQIGELWAIGYRIVGLGWGGNVVFLCDKTKASKLVQELIKKFYLQEMNKVLLSDQVEMYVQKIGMPSSGLCIFNPQSEIWF